MAGIVVVGGGQAGATLVDKLRSEGYAGQLDLICGESVVPYQRPPLSKKYLMGEMTAERLHLRPLAWYAQQDITLHLGQPVTGIDPIARRVHFAGQSLDYSELVLTTGTIPRRLPAAVGGDLAGVYAVRSLADVDAMALEFQPGRRLLIVGGGYIGLEAAAVGVTLGLSVTLVEMAPRILQRVAAPETSDYFRGLHAGHGVTLLEGVGLERLLGDVRVQGARLSDGREMAADFVIAGVGVVPDTRLAEAAGLELDNGVRTDARGRTSAEGIWAAGDCASFPWRGGRLRLESVQNAIDQAELVAENIMGAGRHYVPVPWFWSDQYEVKLQIAGLNTGYDRLIQRPGEGAAVSHWYYAGAQFLAVDAIDDPRAYMIGKRLLEMGRSPDSAVIADPGTNLKALLR